jgi:hypothetical protein
MDAKVDDGFAKVARKIGDGRLEKVLREFASGSIETEIHNAQFLHKRGDTRANMAQLKRDAQRLEKSRSAVSRHLIDLPFPASECLPRAQDVLAEILTLCDETLAMTSPRGGTNKKPGMVICALIVIEAWAAVKGNAPGHNDEDLRETCEQYWRASAGKAGGVSRWDRHITKAKKLKSRRRDQLQAEIAQALRRAR